MVVINTSLGRGSFAIPLQMSESNFPISYTLTIATDAISRFPNGAIPPLTPSRLSAIVPFLLCFVLHRSSLKVLYLTNLTLQLENLREKRTPVTSYFSHCPGPCVFRKHVDAASLQRPCCGVRTPHTILNARNRPVLNGQNAGRRYDHPVTASLAIRGSGQSDVAKTREHLCVGANSLRVVGTSVPRCSTCCGIASTPPISGH